MSQFFTFSPRAAQLVRYTAANSPRWARTGGRLVRRARVPIKRYPLRSVGTAATVGTLVPTPAQKRAFGKFINQRKKRYTMKRLGERIGTDSAKQAILDLAYTTRNPQFLYSNFLLNLPRNTVAGDTRNARNSEMVNFRGIKFCFNIRTEGALGTAKAWFNIAILTPKANLESNEVLPTTEFFRLPGGTQRAIDFGGAGMDNLDYRCYNINTDKYNIHKRLRLTIGPAGSTEGRKERLIEFYMPIKRQIRYNSGSEYPEGKQMYLCYWFTASDAGAPLNSISMNYKLIKYFRDTKH